MACNIIDMEQKSNTLLNGCFFDFICEYLIDIKKIENKKEIDIIRLVGQRSYIFAITHNYEWHHIKGFQLKSYKIKKLIEKINE